MRDFGREFVDRRGKVIYGELWGSKKGRKEKARTDGANGEVGMESCQGATRRDRGGS